MGVSGAKGFFTFVAQSLDNRSPDIISELGAVLPSDNLRSPERMRVIGKTTSISAHGKQWSIPSSMHTWFCVTQLRQVALL